MMNNTIGIYAGAFRGITPSVRLRAGSDLSLSPTSEPGLI